MTYYTLFATPLLFLLVFLLVKVLAADEDAQHVMKLWQEILGTGHEVVERLKELIREHVRENCF